MELAESRLEDAYLAAAEAVQQSDVAGLFSHSREECLWRGVANRRIDLRLDLEES